MWISHIWSESVSKRINTEPLPHLAQAYLLIELVLVDLWLDKKNVAVKELPATLQHLEAAAFDGHFDYCSIVANIKYRGDCLE
jgi:hypothetical protein